MKRRKENDGNGFEAWGGYMNAKITKLQEQFAEDAKVLDKNAKLSNTFEGVAIFVNGHTEPSSEALRRIMLQHGGTFHDYQVSETTHVIASNLPNAKLQQQAFARVLRPEWIVDSVASGKLLPIGNYLLCARSALQPVLPFQPKSDKRAPAKNATDSNFINEFYNNSRLHHLSTMGALLKQYVGKLKENHSGKFPGLERLQTSSRGMNTLTNSTNPERVVMHIDMDSFFVSVALRDRPELIGKPVAVTHARGNNAPVREGVDRAAEVALYEARLGGAVDTKFKAKGGHAYGTRESMSEIASCSYEARARGVKNGMYLGRALSLCPGLLTVPYDFAAYTEVSYALYDTVAEYTLAVEAVSCDEMYIDCFSVLKATGATPLEFASFLRKDVSDRTRCPCSTGLGANKLLARLSSKKAKPNGQYHVTLDAVPEFMADFRVRDLPGVGWSTARKLQDMAIETCAELQEVTLSTLKSQLGDKVGDTLYRFCRGLDDRPVVTEHQRKSVSAEVNYGIRFTELKESHDFLNRLSGEVAERLAGLYLKGRCITLKLLTRSADAPVESSKFLGHGVCDAASRSLLLPTATADSAVIAENVLKLFQQMSVQPQDMRGVGIQVTKLEGKAKPGALQSFLAQKRVKKTEKSKEKKELEPRKEIQVLSKKVTTPKKNIFTKRVDAISEPPTLPPISELDPDVLNALPESIRKEILAQYGATALPGPSNTIKSTFNASEPGTSKSLIPPLDLQDSSSKDSTDSNFCSKNLFSGLPAREVRNLIGSWVELEDMPQLYDVDMLGQHAASLVEKRDIENASVLVKCLWRHVRKFRDGAKEWEDAYSQVVDQVQSVMLKKYKNPMMLP